MEGIFAIFMVFGMPVFLYWLRLHYRALENGHYKKALPDPDGQQRLAAFSDEKRLLAERVANLESIVCSVDFELNQKLNRLAVEAGPPSALALGAGGQRSAPVIPAPAVVQSPVATAPLATSPPMVTEAPTPAPGTLFGRYVVEGELGRGGMGVVLLARDTQLNEPVALKVISSRLNGDPSAAAERFRREASSARKVTHPNVIRIYELGESLSSGELYLAMEYFPSITLADLLRRSGALSIPEARALLSQVCDGLSAAHKAGVIHRDLKPGNILVSEAGSDGARRVKVIDFGLAKSSYLSGMTATGLILGTPEYMSPEQIRGREVDARADIYALGAVAYHMIEGRPPFTGDTPIAVGFAHCTQPVRSPTRAEAPPAMTAAIVRALAKEPRERFETVDALRAELLRA